MITKLFYNTFVQGQRGAQGTIGQKGEKGDQGSVGDRGPTGRDGIPGLHVGSFLLIHFILSLTLRIFFGERCA